MAYVEVPRDLTQFEAKLVFNLTKRQIICFGLGALCGVPTYLALRKIIPNEITSIISFVIMAPFFIAGIFKKDGMPLEKYLYIFLRQKYFRPGIRRYRTSNLYIYHQKNRR